MQIRHGHEHSERPLVSRSSILILSAFLIGAATSQFVSGSLNFPVLAAGAIGLLAFASVECRRESKRRRASQAAIEEAVNELESRFTRHVAHLSKAHPHGRTLRSRRNEDQYLTVVSRNSARSCF